MKKLIIISIIAMSCNGFDNTKQTVVRREFSSGVTIDEIDGCEYVWKKVGYGAGLCHKGNCKFCEERRKNDTTHSIPR